MAKVVLEQEWKFNYLEVEDSGQARIYQIEDKVSDETGLFVRLQSWDETLRHDLFKEFEGKKIRITVESLD